MSYAGGGRGSIAPHDSIDGSVTTYTSGVRAPLDDSDDVSLGASVVPGAPLLPSGDGSVMVSGSGVVALPVVTAVPDDDVSSPPDDGSAPPHAIAIQSGTVTTATDVPRMSPCLH